MSVGELIRKVRINKDISQSQLAHLLDIRQQFISLIENDNKTISVKRLTQLAEVLQVCPKIFIVCNNEYINKCSDDSVKCDKCIYRSKPNKPRK